LATALARFRHPERYAGLPFFVASERALGHNGVLGRVWAPLAKTDRRFAITELPAKEGLDYDVSECIGRCFTEDAFARLMPLSRPLHIPVGGPPRDEKAPPNEGVVA
jgi:hypothetical protein